MMLKTDERIVIRAERQIIRNSVDVYVFVEGPDPEKIGIAKPLTIEKTDRFSSIGEPTMILRPGVAQDLMDELWRCGLRPTEGTGSAGALAAVEKHLADMRSIAFAFTDAALKEMSMAAHGRPGLPTDAEPQEFIGFKK